MSKIDEYYEELVQNVQKGEIYSIKIKDDPQVYSAIPMIPYHLQGGNHHKFVLKILHPKQYAGVHEQLLEDIETLERRL